MNQESIDLATLARAIVDEMAPGRASVTANHQKDGELYVEVTPGNPRAARMAIRGGGDFQYDLYIGQGTLYELLGTDTISAAGQVRAIARAVFAGKFEETFWTVGNKVAKTIGLIQLNGKVGKTRQWHGFYPFRFKKKAHIKYEPY